MNNILSTIGYQQQQHFPYINTNFDPFMMPAVCSQTINSFVAGLQNIIMKQQAIINALVSQTNSHQEKSVQESPVKAEENLTPPSQQGSASVGDLSELTEESVFNEGREAILENRPPKIRRRNGFKTRKINVDPKIEEEGGDLDGEQSPTGRKAAAALQKSKNCSKAKHLWVNYGRRILEYAITQTKGSMQAKIKQLIGKLNSKKDFERIFQIVESDSSEDKLFKTLLGRLGIYFVKHKASPTFESSKYKQEMITQRHTVAAWIERLITS